LRRSRRRLAEGNSSANFRCGVGNGTIGARFPAIIPPMTDADDSRYQTWMCVVCGFIYDEAKGLPEEGLAPGTRWKDIPDTWTCPDCGVTKDDFEMVEVD
jgi:rubredoxin